VHDYFRSWLPKQPGEEARPTQDSKKDLECLLGVASCSPDKWRELESQYEARIDAFDQALGSFLELVEQTLGAGNTFVILLSDHGEGFDHARTRIHHGGRLHRDQLQVPLLVAGPGVKAGRSEELVSLVDVRASVLELVGAADDTKHDGRTFVPLLFAKPVEGRRDAVLASDHFYYWQSGRRRTPLEPSKKPLTAARIDARYWYMKDLYGEELYEVQDTQQKKPLTELLKQRQEPSRQPTAGGMRPSNVELSEELLEQLRGLGYVE
jgi:arylsulfatase A-like enzyme